MNRLFGKAKAKEPAPTLDDASKGLQTRSDSIEDRVKKCDEELLKYKQQLARMKPGPAKKSLQTRAIRCLQQKKIYEGQRDQLMNQQLNIDRAAFAVTNIKETTVTVNAMKAAQKELKAGMKSFKIDDIEDLHDDMGDLLEDADEINEIMGRSYGVPEEIDENDLLDELNALEDDALAEEVSDEVPSYLVNAATAVKNNNRSTVSQSAPSQEVDVDTLGLPSVPQRSLQA